MFITEQGRYMYLIASKRQLLLEDIYVGHNPVKCYKVVGDVVSHVSSPSSIMQTTTAPIPTEQITILDMAHLARKH